MERGKFMIDESRLFISKYGFDLTLLGYHPCIKEGKTIQDYIKSNGNSMFNGVGGLSLIGTVDEDNYPALSIIDFDIEKNIIGATEIKKKEEDVLFYSYKVGSGGILRIYNIPDKKWIAEFYNKENMSLVGVDFDFVWNGVIFTEYKNPVDNKIFDLFQKNFIIPDLTLEDVSYERLLLQIKENLKDKIELLNDGKKNPVRK